MAGPAQPDLFGEVAALERAERRLGVQADLKGAVAFALKDRNPAGGVSGLFLNEAVSTEDRKR
jgi:hypothetical protein